jgi:DUF1009 family protein
MKRLGIIAGNGQYPLLLAVEARKQGVERIVVAAFEGETKPEIQGLVNEVEWMRVGQLGRMISFFEKQKVGEVMMAGQIAPSNLFQLRPDLKALVLLAKLKERNAESIFGAIADELQKKNITLLPATTYLDEYLAIPGHFAGPKLRRMEEIDVEFGFRIAKEMSRLDVGQTVVVKKGTVLAVEAFEGTDAAIRRGGALGKGSAVMVKVSKPNQDFRFDVPVIGMRTLETAREAGVSVIAYEAKKTLLLERSLLQDQAQQYKISMVAV